MPRVSGKTHTHDAVASASTHGTREPAARGRSARPRARPRPASPSWAVRARLYVAPIAAVAHLRRVELGEQRAEAGRAAGADAEREHRPPRTAAGAAAATAQRPPACRPPPRSAASRSRTRAGGRADPTTAPKLSMPRNCPTCAVIIQVSERPMLWCICFDEEARQPRVAAPVGAELEHAEQPRAHEPAGQPDASRGRAQLGDDRSRARRLDRAGATTRAPRRASSAVTLEPISTARQPTTRQHQVADERRDGDAERLARLQERGGAAAERGRHRLGEHAVADRPLAADAEARRSAPEEEDQRASARAPQMSEPSE